MGQDEWPEASQLGGEQVLTTAMLIDQVFSSEKPVQGQLEVLLFFFFFWRGAYFLPSISLFVPRRQEASACYC